MRSNPLVTEALTGLTRQGKAHLEYLAMLLVQAVTVFLWWPKGGVAEMLESQHGPQTLTALVVAMGITTAYFAVRAGAEEIMLPGQHGLRDWAQATSLRPGRILRGYVLGHLVQGLHQLALSSTLLLMAFTISGGEWAPLGWCVAALLVQALFYRLAGAITYLAIGQHRVECRFTVRAILVVLYLVVGWLVPPTSHVALTSHVLGEGMTLPAPAAGEMSAEMAFLAIYGGLGTLAAAVLHWLLVRARRSAAGPRDGARIGEAVTG